MYVNILSIQEVTTAAIICITVLSIM